MPRFLAIDWDDFECRYALASVQGATLSVQKIGAAPLVSANVPPDMLPNDDEEDDSQAGSQPDDGSKSASKTDRLMTLASTLAEIVKREKIGSCPLLLCLGRSQVDMLFGTLPPCRDDEVAALLKNQVLRESSNFSDFDPLDYLSLSSGEKGADAKGPRKLLAVTLPLSQRQLLVRTFRRVGFSVRQIAFRPAAIAGLFFQGHGQGDGKTGRQDRPGEFEPALLVAQSGRDVDLILLESSKIASLRSIRLPNLTVPQTNPQVDTQADCTRIAGEIERTFLVGAESFADRSIHRIYLFGTENDCDRLAQSFGEKEGDKHYDLTPIDPLECPAVLSRSANVEPPERYAALIGVLADQLKQRPVAAKACRIDLLHPREAPKPTNIIRTVFLSLFLLAIACYGLYRWNDGVVRGMEKQLADLQAEYEEVAMQYNQLQPIWNVLRNTQYWDAQGVAWLDELRALSVSLPTEQDLVVSQLSFSLAGAGRTSGTIQLNGQVRDPAVLWDFQKRLHSAGAYQMRNPDIARNPAGGGYPYLFRTSITRQAIR